MLFRCSKNLTYPVRSVSAGTLAIIYTFLRAYKFRGSLLSKVPMCVPLEVCGCVCERGRGREGADVDSKS